MPTAYAKAVVPEDGTLVIKRKEGGEIVVYKVHVEQLGHLGVTRLPGGRKVYHTPDGLTFSDAKDAAKHMNGEI